MSAQPHWWTNVMKLYFHFCGNFVNIVTVGICICQSCWKFSTFQRVFLVATYGEKIMSEWEGKIPISVNVCRMQLISSIYLKFHIFITS